MTLKKRRRRFATEIAIDALLIDEEFSSSVLRPFVSFVRHRACEQREQTAALSSGHNKAENLRIFVAREDIYPPSRLVFATPPTTVPAMLSDRPYMRNDYQREKTSLLIWLLSAMIAGFVVQFVLSVWLNTLEFERLVTLSPSAFISGRFWTLFTYPFRHGSILHLLGIVLPVFFIGRELAPQVGERRLSWLALIAVVGSGLLWLGIHRDHGGELFGAAPILWCFFTLFACLSPNRRISFLIFFVIPITTRPKYIAWSLLGLDLAGFVFAELPGNSFQGLTVPHSAHLGAMLVGWLGAQHFMQANWLRLRPRPEIETLRRMKRPKDVSAASPISPVNLAPNREDLRAEVDRILDKINSHGFGALSPAEKRVLDDARDLLSRR